MGELIIIQSEERNWGKWPLCIFVELITGRDGVVRAAKLRARRNYLEWGVQHLYPLELSCDRTVEAPWVTLSADTSTFRPKRDAVVAAELRIQDAAEDDQ